MKSTKENASNPGVLEDVSIVNSLSEEQFNEMSEGKTIKDGIFHLYWQDVIFGYVYYQYHWALEGGLFICKTTGYKIENKYGGMGHKSNLKFEISSVNSWVHNSPDNLRSDGIKYTYYAGGTVNANGSAIVSATFTYDISKFPDPKVSGSTRVYY